MSENTMIKELLNQIDILENDLTIMNHNIIIKKNNIANIKKFILANCKHNKIIDHSAMNERTEYYCSICNLSLPL